MPGCHNSAILTLSILHAHSSAITYTEYTGYAVELVRWMLYAVSLLSAVVYFGYTRQTLVRFKCTYHSTCKCFYLATNLPLITGRPSVCVIFECRPGRSAIWFSATPGPRTARRPSSCTTPSRRRRSSRAPSRSRQSMTSRPSESSTGRPKVAVDGTTLSTFVRWCTSMSTRSQRASQTHSSSSGKWRTRGRLG